MFNTAKKFFKWEDAEAGDFPAYDNKSSKVPLWGWALIALAIVAGVFLDLNQASIVEILTKTVHLPEKLAAIVAMLALPTVLIVSTVAASKELFTGLFRPLPKAKIGHNTKLVLFTVGVYLLASIVTATLFHLLNIPTVADKSLVMGESSSAIIMGVINILIQLPTQLFGEELLSILPFILFLTFFVSVLKWSRKTSVITAAVLSCLLFGLYHFQAYDWHLAQMFIIIGLGRLVVLFLYLKTKNLWLTFFTRLLIDGTIVLFGLLQLLK